MPDLAIEVISDSTARGDRTEKKEIYAFNGVDEYWLVDPDARDVTVLHREVDRFATAEPMRTDLIHSRVLPDLTLSIDDLFRDLR